MTEVVVEMIENPYHRAEIKPHHLDRAEARLACFHAFSIATASQALGGQYEMADEDEEVELSSLFRLHHDLAEPRLSQLLLQIAVFVRTYDDVMRDLGDDTYVAHAAATEGVDFIGSLDGAELPLREACNKIIHAADFRPVYDHSDRLVADNEYRRVWYMTGEIELEGQRGKQTWEALLHVDAFLETVLDRIAFEPAAGVE